MHTSIIINIILYYRLKHINHSVFLFDITNTSSNKVIATYSTFCILAITLSFILPIYLYYSRKEMGKRYF